MKLLPNRWAVAAIVLGVLFGATYLRFAIRPAIEVVVPLPMADARVRMQGWAGFLDDGPEILVIETSAGTLHADLGSDWGSGPRVLLYRTPQDQLGVLRDGATFEAVVDLSGKSGPSFVPTQSLDSAGWTYLGAIVLKHIDGARFVLPTESDECYPMLGAGSSHLRKAHQVEHMCLHPKPGA
ncbi:hypothetical protein ABZT49_13180 [Methylobacterium sp. EM32]|uniref:hypothetical protein n=1 Tax=Methylobacterium sp. EM32 TaxID=3163481 RepID=UPI0033B92097